MVLVCDRIAPTRSALSGGRSTLVAISAGAWAAPRTSPCDRVGLLPFDAGVRQTAGDCESVEHHRRPYPPALSLAHVRPGDMPQRLMTGHVLARTRRHPPCTRTSRPSCPTRGARGERIHCAPLAIASAPAALRPLSPAAASPPPGPPPHRRTRSPGPIADSGSDHGNSRVRTAGPASASTSRPAQRHGERFVVRRQARRMLGEVLDLPP